MYFQEMKENGFEPDTRTYTMLIKACGPKNIEHALEYFEEMETENIYI